MERPDGPLACHAIAMLHEIRLPCSQLAKAVTVYRIEIEGEPQCVSDVPELEQNPLFLNFRSYGAMDLVREGVSQQAYIYTWLDPKQTGDFANLGGGRCVAR